MTSMARSTVDDYYDQLPDDEKLMWKLKGRHKYLLDKMESILDGAELRHLQVMILCEKLDIAVTDLQATIQEMNDNIKKHKIAP